MGEKHYILGIDPGTSGAWALLAPDSGVVHVYDFPLMEHFGHNVIDYKILSAQMGAFKDQIQLAVIEDVHSMPMQGVASTFSFGVSKGVVLGLAASFMIPIYTPPPAIWKMNLGLTKDKQDSFNLATKLFPDYSHHWTKKSDDGKAEALLLAHFGKRFYKKEIKVSDFKRSFTQR